MAHTKPKKPSVGIRLQIATLGPLVVGILLSSLVTVIILFSEHLDWISETENYLVEKEQEHLIRAAVARSELFQAYFENVRFI